MSHVRVMLVCVNGISIWGLKVDRVNTREYEYEYRGSRRRWCRLGVWRARRRSSARSAWAYSLPARWGTSTAGTSACRPPRSTSSGRRRCGPRSSQCSRGCSGRSSRAAPLRRSRTGASRASHSPGRAARTERSPASRSAQTHSEDSAGTTKTD